jgi:small subunit ribosomal protein S1
MGQPVKAQVLEVDREKRRLKLGIKQMAPSSLDEYIAEHKEGDVVTGRIVESSAGFARVELGEGVQASCRTTAKAESRDGEKVTATASTGGAAKADLSSLSSMLSARWKGGAPSPGAHKAEATQAGQVRSFRIRKLDAPSKKIEVELA